MRNLFKVLGVIIGVFLIVVFATMTFSLIKNLWFNSGSNSEPHVAVVVIDGMIVESKRALDEIDEVLENPSAKALVIKVNSPGGLVAPSQELYQGILRADKKIPVLISMDALAASGGYYLALGGRKIFANPGTLTASIGVIMEFMNTQKLYEWAKVERYTITGGKFKATGTPLRPMTPEERALLEGMVANIHSQFREAVSSRRNLTGDALDNTTDGRVMTGEQALEAKLVDSLGGFFAAVEEAKALAKLKEDAPVRYKERRVGLVHRILFGEEDPNPLKNWLNNFLFQLPHQSFHPGWRVMLLSPVR